MTTRVVKKFGKYVPQYKTIVMWNEFDDDTSTDVYDPFYKIKSCNSKEEAEQFIKELK